jgi:hypothetical protein
MIVISMPRCGGTKFCMDKAEETGKRFVGDLDIMNLQELYSIWAKIKFTHHEVGPNHYQALRSDEMVEYITNSKDYIILSNHNFLQLMPYGDYYLLRKNKRDILSSILNYWLRIGNGDLTKFTLEDLTKMAVTCKIYTLFLEKNNIEPIWYEDYFNNKRHNPTWINQHKDKRTFNSYIDNLVAEYKL